MTEIYKEIGMEDADHVIARIRSLRRSEVKMQILEEQQRVLNATAARMREQLDLARAEQQAAERKANASAQALTDV